MSDQAFPEGWDADRVQRLIRHYEGLSEADLVAEDEAADPIPGQAIVVVPEDLLPAIRQLIAAREGS